MVELKEKDFIIGNEEDCAEAMVTGEDVNAYIDSVLEQIYALDLTKEEEEQLGLKIHRDKYDDTWKRVEFSFGPGNRVLFSSRLRDKKDGKVVSADHELTCHGQLESDRKLSILTGFGLVGSHRLFSYDDDYRPLYFDRGKERKMMIRDAEDKLTQFTQLGIAQSIEYQPQYSTFGINYLDRSTYKEGREYKDGTYRSVYTDLEGNPLKPSMHIATSFPSFDEAFATFTSKFEKCRELIDARIQEIKAQKTI